MSGCTYDRLSEIFRLQQEFMEMLVEDDKLPEFPVDITSKCGQRLIKEMVFNVVEELAEASFTLKNRQHKVSDDSHVDRAHYKEELADALAYFIEVCILSGIGPDEFFNEYCKKNAIVKERLLGGY